MVTRMTAYSTAIRATHLLTNAAWFGGSLMGAVAAQPGRAGRGHWGRARPDIGHRLRRGGARSRAAPLRCICSAASRSSPTTVAALSRTPTSAAGVAKTALTGAALAATGAAYLNGARLGEALVAASSDPHSEREAATRAQRMRWRRATPAATAGLLVLDAYLGEQQRGPAGLLDRPSKGPGR